MKSLMKSVAVCAAVVCGVASPALATTYTWNGGESGSWCESANWLADGAEATAWPSALGDRVEFAADSTATVDLGLAELTIGLLQVKANATVEIKNGTISFGSPNWNNSDANILANATLKLNAVTATVRSLGNNNFNILYGAGGRFELVNGTALTTSSYAWLPNAGGGAIVLNDSTANIAGGFHLGYDWSTTRTGNKVNESFCATNSVIDVNGVAIWRGGYLRLMNTTMNSQGSLLFYQLNKNNGYVTPTVEISGTSKATFASVGYKEWYDIVEKWVFNVASDEPVLQLKGTSTIGGSFNPYLTVTAPEGWQSKYPTGVAVPLITCDGQLTLPATWKDVTESTSVVKIGEDVTRVVYDADSRRLIAHLKGADNPVPSAALVGEPVMETIHSLSAMVNVMTKGDGATSYAVLASLYSDPDRTQLVETKVVEAAVTEEPKTFTALFENLTLGETYYGTLSVSNDLDRGVSLDFEKSLVLLPQEGNDYVWKGYGDGKSIDDPFNWGVCDAYPSNENANLVFPVRSVAEIDLNEEDFQFGLIKMCAKADVTFKNGTLSVRDMLQVSDTLEGSGSNRLAFDGVDFTRRATSYFVYGSFKESKYYSDSIATKCQLEFVNGSVFRVPDTASVLFIFGSGEGQFTFEDSTVYMGGFIPSEWGSNDVRCRVVNSRVVCNRPGESIAVKSWKSGSPFYFENAVFEGFVGGQLTTKGLTCVGATDVSCVNKGGSFSISEAEHGALTMTATADGFPKFSVVGGGLTVSTDQKLVLSQIEAGRPRRGVWTLFETDGTLTVPGSWTSGPLDQCGAFCTYSGFDKPEKYTLIVEPTRVALKYPGSGMKVLIQ